MHRNGKVIFSVIKRSIVLLSLCASLFFRIPTSETVPESVTTFTEQIPTSDEVPEEEFYRRKGSESASPWELLWWTLSEDEKYFWQMFAFSFSLIVLTSLLILQTLDRYWYKEDEREQGRRQMEMVLQQVESFVQPMRVTMAGMQQAQDKFQKKMELMQKQMSEKDVLFTGVEDMADVVKTMKARNGCCAKVENQVDLIGRQMGAVDERLAKMEKWINLMKIVAYKEKRKKEILLTDFQNVINILKKMMEGDERCAKLQDHIDLTEKQMRAVDEHFAKYAKVMNAMKTCLSVPPEQTVGHVERIDSPVDSETTKKSYTVAWKSVGKEKEEASFKRNIRISKIPARVELLPYAKPLAIGR
jgi:hypothetical protein